MALLPAYTGGSAGSDEHSHSANIWRYATHPGTRPYCAWVQLMTGRSTSSVRPPQAVKSHSGVGCYSNTNIAAAEWKKRNSTERHTSISTRARLPFFPTRPEATYPLFSGSPLNDFTCDHHRRGTFRHWSARIELHTRRGLLSNANTRRPRGPL